MIKHPAPLNPKSQVVAFNKEHVSLVDNPANGKEFLLIQDSYGSGLAEAISDLYSLVGPLMQYFSNEAWAAFRTCEEYLAGVAGGTYQQSVGPMYSAAQKTFEAFDYKYPTPAQLVPIIENLELVPADAASGVGDAARTIQALCRAYTPAEWPLSPTAVYSYVNPLKDTLTSEVVRKVAAGQDASMEAALVTALKPDTGLLIQNTTPLWGLIRSEETPDKPAAEPAAPATPAVQPEPVVDPTNPEGGTMPSPDAEQRARASIRALIETADPSLVVKPDEGLGGGMPAPVVATPAAQVPERSVNPESSAQGVALPEELIAGMERALSTQGLTTEQKEGITRHYSGLIAEALAKRFHPESPAATGTPDIADAMRRALDPFIERLDRIESAISASEPERPNPRRSLLTRPNAGEEKVRTAYTPHSVKELAERGVIV